MNKRRGETNEVWSGTTLGHLYDYKITTIINPHCLQPKSEHAQFLRK